MKIFGIYAEIKGRPFHIPIIELEKMRPKRRRRLVGALRRLLDEIEGYGDK